MIVIKLTANYFIQNFFERSIKLYHFYMGIGAGARVGKSGEFILFRSLIKLLDPPYCIFDVGSNKGQFLKLILDELEESDCDIHCFEPNSGSFEKIDKEFGERATITLNNFGMSNKEGESILYFDKKCSTLAAQTKRRLDHFNISFNKTEKITINTIDNYCSNNSIKHINLLKIDIEGHELEALEGAREMFLNQAIDIVSFEFGGANIDTKSYFQDFWYFFQQFDFNLFRITPSGYLFPIKSYQETYEQFRTTNFVAVNNSYSI